MSLIEGIERQPRRDGKGNAVAFNVVWWKVAVDSLDENRLLREEIRERDGIILSLSGQLKQAFTQIETLIRENDSLTAQFDYVNRLYRGRKTMCSLLQDRIGWLEGELGLPHLYDPIDEITASY